MSKRYYACVFGGASDKIAEIHKQKIYALGQLITDAGFSLVYGAGATGAMGAVARGARDSGGYIMGVSPSFIRTFEEIFDCDNTVIVDTMAERKTLMEKHGDIYFIAPGGVGTMDEFFQVLTLKYLERIDAPIIILNIDGFYDSLILLMKALEKNGAVKPEVFDMFEVVDDVDERVLEMMKAIKIN